MSELSGLPFGIGSLPHTDPRAACELILTHFARSPFWPELPRRDWRESIGVEQARGLPGFIIDAVEKHAYFDSRKDVAGDLEVFYENYLAGENAPYGLSGGFMAGFDAMLELLNADGRRPMVLKGQLSGPTTLGLILRDELNKPLLYNDQAMDILVKATGMKAAWMATAMGEVCARPVVFFDEPMLQSIGSAAIPIDRSIAVDRLKELVQSVDCLTGGHCCGNTDWSILIEAGLDIIAFDAWLFSEKLTLYSEQLRGFIEGGGLLAWGIVPASTLGVGTAVGAIYDKLMAGMELIGAKAAIPLETLIDHSLVTPSCGLGSLTEDQAGAILAATAAVAAKLRQ